jgi:hypothetical protein
VKKFISVLVLILIVTNVCNAEETVFHLVRLADAKGTQTDASLTLSDSSKALIVRVADHEFATIPYQQVDKFSYEYTRKHRIASGAVTMLASPGIGIIVMLTKSKSHWLDIDYREQNLPKTIVLRMSKHEYRGILSALKTHTGKEVEVLGEVANPSKKDKQDAGKDKS